jgi:hypothetical protein
MSSLNNKDTTQFDIKLERNIFKETTATDLDSSIVLFGIDGKYDVTQLISNS